MKDYAIKISHARMPHSCWGRYARIALVEVDPDDSRCVKRIAVGGPVLAIVATWERLHVGDTTKCAYHVALTEARKMATDLLEDGQEACEYGPARLMRDR